MIIRSSGTYTLSSSVGSSGQSVVTINADNVVLDLNGFTVSSTAADKATAVTFGIMCSGRSNITIRNGAITGAMFGVHGGYGNGIILENIDFTGCTYIGAHLAGSKDGNAVRNCKFHNITGYKTEAYAIGLNGIGPNGIIEDCSFKNLYRQPGVAGTGEGVGALIEANASNVTVKGNTFINDRVDTNSIGIWVAAGASATVTDNSITNFHKGVQGNTVTASSNTLTIPSGTANSVAFACKSGVASNNAITGYVKIVDGGIIDGGGNLAPAPVAPSEPAPAPTQPDLNGKVINLTIDNIAYTATLSKV